ncbi:MAG: ribonuclease T2 [Hyphomicrobiales bacterium]|nr:ribonuclease T2 [Hyphomicrobiales bacterium]MBV8664047.1 ribonuclease T2 [Hyphomicrobiales bacterium]
MRFGRNLALALMSLALAAATPAPAAHAQDAGDFDFYVLTLSWSPGFCDTGGAGKSPTQCAVGTGSGFVVHGLWPDRARGPNPENCQYGVHIPAAAIAATEGVYPDEGLARYEYLKHGTCSGLDPAAYFGAVKTLRDGIVVPDMFKAPHQAMTLAPSAIEQAFVAANANLQPANMAVTCRNGEFIDVRLCVAKDLRAFANCPKVAGHTCHASAITVAPLR